MKRINLILCLMACNSAFAFVSHGGNPNTIYCPAEINCTKDDDISSCNLNGINSDYWQLQWHEGVHIKAGSYKFNNAYGWYPSAPASSAICQYKDFTSGIVANRHGADIEALYGQKNLWISSHPNATTCNSPNAKDCPFNDKPEVMFSMVTSDRKHIKTFHPVVNGTVIKGALYDNYYSVSYDQLAEACGAVEQCSFRVDWSFYDNAISAQQGEITISMADRMKIIQIDNSRCNQTICKYRLDQILPFNTIQFVKN